MSNRTESLRVRTTQEEIVAFTNYANKMGETRSRLLRKLIREMINNEPDLLFDEQALFRQAANQLVGCARNLNQMTAAINAGKFKDSHLDRQIIQATLIAVNDLKSILNLYLKRTHLRWVKPLEADS